MTKTDVKKIQKLALEKYGSIRIAIAAIIYGEAIILDCNNDVPVWADQEEINKLESQINSSINQTEQSNAEKPVSIATEADGANQENAEKVEETETTEAEEKEFKEQTQFSEVELFEIVLSANRQNITTGAAIIQKLYGEKGFDADGSFSGLVNVHKVAYVKGLITQLLNAKTAEKVEESQPAAETPTEANTEPNKDESNTASEAKSEAELAEEKPA